MIPSLVASEVEDALRDFLASQFRPSNAEMSSVIDDFLEDRSNFLKGPYLSISLPFQHAPEGGEPFPEIPLGFDPYRHQREAFERLSQNQSTVIATGTGSGKTECFLFPILDWCRQNAGLPGIKAILIYPMNALATDQAARIAKLIHTTPSLKGKVTAGIYIGQSTPSRQGRMTESHIIANRETIVERPPDILLTNYKMLDYLLSRPKDQRLWRHNTPASLRWLVVDELHTFDGAQGTDLACLIRRLKARLGMSGDDLICVGTSATLGSGPGPGLIPYVSDIFGSKFDADAVITESRLTIDDFLGSSIISGFLMPTGELPQLVDRSRYATTEDYLRAQSKLFFSDTPGPDFLTDEWRVALAQRLRQHASFVNLLRALEGRPKPLGEILDMLRPSLPPCSDSEARGILNGLCALVSAARTVDPTLPDARPSPFLQVSLHLWVRELGRMVCSLSEPPIQDLTPPVNYAPHDHEPVAADYSASFPADTEHAAADSDRQQHFRRLRASDDLGPDESSLYLPLIQCNQCWATGWGALLNSGSDRVLRDLRVFYNQFFARDLAVKFLFPEKSRRKMKGAEASVCGACGAFALGKAPGKCPKCKAARVVDVFVPEMVVGTKVRDKLRRVISTDCPFCHATSSLFIFGSRTSVLLSVALAQTYSSSHNDDRKVIAFSDNVQDAAHRAGFLSHRTWRNIKRAAIAQVLKNEGSVSMAVLPRKVLTAWSDKNASPFAFDHGQFITQFIAPDRTWYRSFREFLKTGHSPTRELVWLVGERLKWEVLAEFGFASRVAHSLERSRTAAAGPRLEPLEAACKAATPRIQEDVEGLEEVDLKAIRWIALGVLRRMKARGAILCEDVGVIKTFLRTGGNRWHLHQNRALPEFGPKTPMPVFPSESGPGIEDGIEPMIKRYRDSWYQQWVRAVLQERFALLPPFFPTVVLTALFDCLAEHGLVKIQKAQENYVWAIDSENFVATADAAVLRCSSAARELVVPSAEGPLWIGAPCLDLGVRDIYKEQQPAHPTWAGKSYLGATIHRVIAEEHTALLKSHDRQERERRFAADNRRPWDPNMLSATPTLELGIDIGSLSTVALCSVPPTQANYLQRIGRAGRRDGNAFTVTMAAAQPHDLFFYQEPLQMLAGEMHPPGVFLDASSVLERQLTAFCLDNWAASCGDPNAVPPKISTVLKTVEKRNQELFPYTFFDYTAQHSDLLHERFLAAFEGSLTEESKDHLKRFLVGDPGKSPQLRIRILERLEGVVQELKSIQSDVRKLRKKVKDLKEGAQDEATPYDIDDHEREKRGFLRMGRDIRNRDTYGWLTDEGLIPNYAFPEEGVKLRSVILRRPMPQQAGQQLPDDVNFEEFEYIRPAASALTEFAPGSRFYAGGHRVEIDRINLQLTTEEKWRLCPTCTHCRCIDQSDEFQVCPRCGDPMWADSGQVRRMLRLRLVHASTPIQTAQIKDDRDDRELAFFTRHLVADFDPEAARRAFATTSSGSACGFEYASHTTFREINFGRRSAKGRPTKFAGEETPREGFRVCKKCGKVQPRRADARIKHALSCPSHSRKIYAKPPDSAGWDIEDRPEPLHRDLLDCLYLYREFQSESLRMLIPSTERTEDGSRQSFIAALELGLRERFGGRIDHLRVMTTEVPAKGSGVMRRFIVLYDTVPGGTGYLKQLLQSGDEIIEVFRRARARLGDCDCDDGCYRCVFAYRRSREMEKTSKLLAIGLLDKILDVADQLEKVNSIDGLQEFTENGSDLELRFLQYLQQLAIADPRITMRPDIVRGKAGYVLEIGSETWSVEPQVDLNDSHGVAVASRPDFLFRPAKPTENKRPVAVFLDGFRYHKDSVGEDSAKRMALVRAGYIQWSLTWRDFEAEDGNESAAEDLVHGYRSAADGRNTMRALQEKFDAKWSVGPLRSRLRDSTIELFLRYLEEPDFERWRRSVFTDLLRVFSPTVMTDSGFQQRFRKTIAKCSSPQVLEHLEQMSSPVYMAGRGEGLDADFKTAALFVALTQDAIRNGDPHHVLTLVHLRDGEPDRTDFQSKWNSVLRQYNTLQFLPHSWWTTSSGVNGDMYPYFSSESEAVTGASPEWKEAIDLAARWARPLLGTLSGLSLPVPEIGYELMGRSGVVVAEAEIAWPEATVAVLPVDQPSDAEKFGGAGWRVWDENVEPETIRAAF